MRRPTGAGSHHSPIRRARSRSWTDVHANESPPSDSNRKPLLTRRFLGVRLRPWLPLSGSRSDRGSPRFTKLRPRCGQFRHLPFDGAGDKQPRMFAVSPATASDHGRLPSRKAGGLPRPGLAVADYVGTWVGRYLELAVQGVRSPEVAGKITAQLARFADYITNRLRPRPDVGGGAPRRRRVA